MRESNWSKVKFIGGDYGNYWYTYVGAEAGVNGGLSFGASVDGSIEFFIVIYTDGKNSGSPHPTLLEGDYTAFAINAEVHAGMGVSGLVISVWSETL